MYLLKDIYASDYGKGTTVISGMLVQKRLKDDKLVIANDSWGETKVVFGNKVDISKFKNNTTRFMLPFVSEIIPSTDISDSIKETTFVVNEQSYDKEKIEGYVVFIDHSNSEIQTTGEIVYMKNCKEAAVSLAVVILREGNTLEFDGRLVEVVNNKLMLNI